MAVSTKKIWTSFNVFQIKVSKCNEDKIIKIFENENNYYILNKLTKTFYCITIAKEDALLIKLWPFLKCMSTHGIDKIADVKGKTIIVNIGN